MYMNHHLPPPPPPELRPPPNDLPEREDDNDDEDEDERRARAAGSTKVGEDRRNAGSVTKFNVLLGVWRGVSTVDGGDKHQTSNMKRTSFCSSWSTVRGLCNGGSDGGGWRDENGALGSSGCRSCRRWRER
jgi:hypothetical protein